MQSGRQPSNAFWARRVSLSRICPSPTPTPTTMATNQTRPPSGIKIYNAVYSSVQVSVFPGITPINQWSLLQVYECMIRGIAVMRRRADSYVNATQILKVAGIDKGRRTKILEKEILPGKHEIVQGGYGKYQGTWFVYSIYFLDPNPSCK